MAKFDYKKVADPEFFKENVLPVHADFIAYASDDELEQGISSFNIFGIVEFPQSI